jgi:hypothetical protein
MQNVALTVAHTSVLFFVCAGTFCLLAKDVPLHRKELALGAASIADTVGTLRCCIILCVVSVVLHSSSCVVV